MAPLLSGGAGHLGWSAPDGVAGPSFHGDATSVYQVRDATNPTSDRILVWVEKGTWSVSGRAEVPYMLSAEGLTDAEFWQIANGLHPNQI